jgi:hypothetical protein
MNNRLMDGGGHLQNLFHDRLAAPNNSGDREDDGLTQIKGSD